MINLSHVTDFVPTTLRHNNHTSLDGVFLFLIHTILWSENTHCHHFKYMKGKASCRYEGLHLHRSVRGDNTTIKGTNMNRNCSLFLPREMDGVWAGDQDQWISAGQDHIYIFVEFQKTGCIQTGNLGNKHCIPRGDVSQPRMCLHQKFFFRKQN